MKKKIACFLAGFVLVLLPVLIYQPSLNGDFLWDDDAHVTENTTIQSPDGLWSIWFVPGSVPQYYPVTHSVFWAEYQLWGWSTFPYRVVNALLHGISAMLVWVILRRLKLPGAIFAALIFAVHPVHVESVAWITELKNVLSGVFYLLSLYVWLKFTGPLEETGAQKRNWWLFALCAVLFLLALLSKTVTATLPAVMFLLLWWKRPKLVMRDIWPLVPLFILGVGMGLMTASYEKHIVGAAGPDFDFSPVERVLIAGRALCFYFSKLLWPDPLMFVYPRWEINQASAGQYLFPAIVLSVMGILFALRHRIGKGPLVAVLFFAGTLMPALGFLNVYPFVFSFVADHFDYLASLGIIAMVAGAGATLAYRMGTGGRAAGVVVGLVIVCMLAGKTWSQSKVYVDLETLYLDVLAKNPKAWMPQNNLANYYIKHSKWDLARKYALASLANLPRNDKARNTLASIYLHEGKKQEAIEQYDLSIQINPSEPKTHINMARLLVETKQPELAMPYLERALVLSPDDTDIYLIRGSALLMLGRVDEAEESFAHFKKVELPYMPWDSGAVTRAAGYESGMAQVMAERDKPDEAIAHYETSLKIRPNQPEVYNNLATLYAKQGRTTEAVRYFRLALDSNPENLVIRSNLAQTLLHMGKQAEAAIQFAEIYRIDPSNLEALTSLADAYLVIGELDHALAAYQKLLKLDPLDAHIHNSAGVVYMLQDQATQAAVHFETALKLSPEFVDAWFNLGLLNLKHNRVGPAQISFKQVIKLDPEHGAAWYQLGWIDELQNLQAQAIKNYQVALAKLPDATQVRLRMSWIYATSMQPELRQPQLAVKLAGEAVSLTQSKDAAALEGLALAQASAGEYGQAVDSATAALEIAEKTQQLELVKQIKQRMILYKANQPYAPLPAGQ